MNPTVIEYESVDWIQLPQNRVRYLLHCNESLDNSSGLENIKFWISGIVESVRKHGNLLTHSRYETGWFTVTLLLIFL